MKVSNGYNPYSYQQQKTNTKHTGFADMLVNQTKAVKDTAAASYTAETKKVETPAANEQSAAETIAEKLPYLSQEQAKYLSGKYDINNLSKEDEKALLNDLENMGIISKDENTKVYARLAKVPPDWMHGGIRAVDQHWTTTGDGNLIPSDIPYPMHYSSTSREMTLYDYLQGMITDENRLYDEGKEKYGEKAVAYMTDLMQTHQKLLSVLEEIKTGS